MVTIGLTIPRTAFAQRHALLSGTASYGEEIAAVRLCKPPIAFREIRGDGEHGAVQLVHEKAVAFWETLGERGDLVGEVHGLLADLDLFEHEGHEWYPNESEQVNS